jgi:hypothetical protein
MGFGHANLLSRRVPDLPPFGFTGAHLDGRPLAEWTEFASGQEKMVWIPLMAALLLPKMAAASRRCRRTKQTQELS